MIESLAIFCYYLGYITLLGCFYLSLILFNLSININTHYDCGVDSDVFSHVYTHSNVLITLKLIGHSDIHVHTTLLPNSPLLLPLYLTGLPLRGPSCPWSSHLWPSLPYSRLHTHQDTLRPASRTSLHPISLHITSINVEFKKADHNLSSPNKIFRS